MQILGFEVFFSNILKGLFWYNYEMRLYAVDHHNSGNLKSGKNSLVAKKFTKIKKYYYKLDCIMIETILWIQNLTKTPKDFWQ